MPFIARDGGRLTRSRWKELYGDAKVRNVALTKLAEGVEGRVETYWIGWCFACESPRACS